MHYIAVYTEGRGARVLMPPRQQTNVLHTCEV